MKTAASFAVYWFAVLVVIFAAFVAARALHASRRKRLADRENHERLAEDCVKQAAVHRELADRVEADGDADRATRLRAIAIKQDSMAREHRRYAKR